MNHDETLFDTVFKEEGGLYKLPDEDKSNPNLFLNQLKTSIEYFIDITRKQYPKTPYINFNFINNQTLNASAVMVDGKYYIGINIGAFLLVFDMFFKMFSTREIYPDIGDINLETDAKKTLKRFLYQDDIHFNHHKAGINAPKDQIRLSCAIYMAFDALNYLIYHEIGHVLNGHCGYFNSLVEETWNEFGDKKLLSFLDSQTMEMDADSYALNIFFNRAISYTKIKKVDLTQQILYENLETFFSYWIFSIYSFHRLCNFENFKIEDCLNSTHPPPWLRITLMASKYYNFS